METIFHDNNINTLKLAYEIKGILLDTAHKCKLKHKKSHEGNPSAVWFDSECEKKKKQLQKLSRKLKNTPDNVCTRTELFSQKKSFKKLVKGKKMNLNSRH